MEGMATKLEISINRQYCLKNTRRPPPRCSPFSFIPRIHLSPPIKHKTPQVPNWQFAATNFVQFFHLLLFASNIAASMPNGPPPSLLLPPTPLPPLLLWLHRLNALFCLFVGLPLNSLLIWFIFKWTSKYSQILLQTCIIDMLVLILAELVQPVFFVRNGVGHDLMTGYLGWLPNPANHILFLCWFFTFYFSLVGLAVQFLYRYYVLCRGARLSSGRYFAILAFAFLCQLPLMALLVKCSYPSKEMEMVEDEQVMALLGPGPAENGRWRLALRSESADPLLLFWFALFLLHNSTLYGLIVFCAAKIRSSLARQMAQLEMSKLSAELNGQVTCTLLVQALLPVFPLLLCSLGASSIVFSPPEIAGSAILMAQILITIPFSWIPVVNPMVTLVIVRQYRKCIIKSARRLIGKAAHPNRRLSPS